MKDDLAEQNEAFWRERIDRHLEWIAGRVDTELLFQRIEVLARRLGQTPPERKPFNPDDIGMTSHLRKDHDE